MIKVYIDQVRDMGTTYIEVAIFAKREFDKDYERFYFNEKGQLQDWHYGFFG